ncbi:MAG: hypothetical protein WCE82_06345, partial [Halobacteriota archaeon]
RLVHLLKKCGNLNQRPSGTLSARAQETFISRRSLITILNGSTILGTASSVQNLKEIQIKQIARNN